MIPPKEKEDGGDRTRGQEDTQDTRERELGWRSSGINGDGCARRERESETD